MELENCKREVAKERTRVLEREQVIGRHKRRAEEERAAKEQKDKDRADANRSRYDEVVEEQKGMWLFSRGNTIFLWLRSYSLS